ncbi:MAG: ABC transporter permease [Flavobacteriales bacterium]|nr:ABC transporter permease [Flavobacteriales bacterium]
MNKIWLIIKREYSVRVKKKSFIVMTFLGPILFGLFLFAAAYVAVQDFEQYHVLIVDQRGWISEPNNGQLESNWPQFFTDDESSQVIYEFTDSELSDEAFRESPFNVQVIIDSTMIMGGSCPMLFKHKPSESIEDEIVDNLEKSIERYRVLDMAFDYEAYQRAKVRINLAGRDIDAGEKLDLSSERAAFGFGFAALIYIFIFVYGVQVMRGVIEEKTNRIVEVIVSSVKPFQLMMGKVIGIGLVGLTQFVMWIVLSSIISSFVMGGAMAGGEQGTANRVENLKEIATAAQPLPGANMEMESNSWLMAMQQINWGLMLGMFIFFFIGGYLLYGSLFAAIGAAVDNETDTQQFMLPITLPLVFSYVVAAMMMTNPDSSMANFFAIFPLTSPIIMMVKTAIGVQPWIVICSIIALIATFVFMIWVAARIYRVGILMYGKKPTYKELWKWMSYNG